MHVAFCICSFCSLSTKIWQLQCIKEPRQIVFLCSIHACIISRYFVTAFILQFPDEKTADTFFNGIKFKDLPYITIRCTFNNTRFWVNKADGKLVYYTSPKLNGFLNAKKRTSVAAQSTAIIVGQKLRLLNMRTVRVRITGFNQGRITAVKGLVQSGTKVVAIQDITTVDWGWCQRAKKAKRQN